MTSESTQLRKKPIASRFDYRLFLFSLDLVRNFYHIFTVRRAKLLQYIRHVETQSLQLLQERVDHCWTGLCKPV